ncbi:hypothetical protein HPB47_013709 [Ixodes persulcatus]|uniref:Uncharacterized protein n=1 Tax=Ixodes persulcatus TaxID=34615 RepID=A0AC60QZN1_IXOPE|nr:hypothetical protein HPB47_013709 [Ixodes persulcatus]
MDQAAMPASGCSGSSVKKKQRAQHCFVPGCKSGYRSSEHKHSLFTVPKDPGEFAQWQRNIPRADVSLSSTSAVCELRFEEVCIERFYADSHVINGEAVRLKRDRPVLKPDAVPTVFPNLPKYFTKKLARKRKTRKKPASKPRVKQSHTEGGVSVDKSLQPLGPEELHELDYYSSEVTLPSQKWTKLRFLDSVAFASVKLNDAKSELSTEKLLLLSITAEAVATCTLHLKGRQFSQIAFSGPSELQGVLDNADRVVLCGGAGTTEDFNPLQLANTPTVLLRNEDVISRQCTLAVEKEGQNLMSLQPFAPPPVFRGKADEELEDWLHLHERYGRSLAWTDEQKADNLVFALEDVARRWYVTALREQTPETWVSWQKALRETFAGDHVQEWAYIRLQEKRQQPGETPQQ